MSIIKPEKVDCRMSNLDEINLRWLAASIGLPEDEKKWNEQQIERWIFIVHEYEDKLSVERLTEQLGRLRKMSRIPFELQATK